MSNQEYSPSIQEYNSAESSATASIRHRISHDPPSSFTTIPLVSGVLGLFIGMSRGGRRARLQFLAENSHRMPNTLSGQYFYQKTRNYRMALSAMKLGFKYASAIGGTTLLYCVLDESIGLVRERYLGVKKEGKKVEGLREVWDKSSWRDGEPFWEDGALAGGLLGTGVAVVYTLPRALAIRSILMGSVVGGVTSGLQIARDRLGKTRAEEIIQMKAQRKAEEDALLPVASVALGKSAVDDRMGSRADRMGSDEDHEIVDRGVRPGEEFSDFAEEGFGATKEVKGWGSWAKGFIPGRGS